MPFELYTCLLEVANQVNERPFGRIPNDPDDGVYLCPNDILLSRATNRVPQGTFRHTDNPRHRVEFCQKIVDSFWKRWSRDVLPHLVPRKKWNAENRNVRVGDFVIVADANAVRGNGTWVKSCRCSRRRRPRTKCASEDGHRNIHTPHYKDLCHLPGRRLY